MNVLIVRHLSSKCFFVAEPLHISFDDNFILYLTVYGWNSSYCLLNEFFVLCFHCVSGVFSTFGCLYLMVCNV